MKIIVLLFSLLLFNISIAQVTPSLDSAKVTDQAPLQIKDSVNIIRTGNAWPKHDVISGTKQHRNFFIEHIFF